MSSLPAKDIAFLAVVGSIGSVLLVLQIRNLYRLFKNKDKAYVNEPEEDEDEDSVETVKIPDPPIQYSKRTYFLAKEQMLWDGGTGLYDIKLVRGMYRYSNKSAPTAVNSSEQSLNSLEFTDKAYAFFMKNAAVKCKLILNGLTYLSPMFEICGTFETSKTELDAFDNLVFKIRALDESAMIKMACIVTESDSDFTEDENEETT